MRKIMLTVLGLGVFPAICLPATAGADSPQPPCAATYTCRQYVPGTR